MTTTLATRADSRPAIIQIIDRMKPEIQRAMPRLGITPDRMARLATTALKNTPKLLDCDQTTVLAGIMQLAQLGLEPCTPLGHAWLIPYGSKCQVVIGYRGYIVLADRAGITIGAEVVYSRDHWNHPRPGETVIDFLPHMGEGDRGTRVCAFAYATRSDRPIQFRVASPADIERARQSSSAVKNGRKDSPWFGDENGKPTDTDSMWCKTAIRRLVPYLPLSSEDAARMAQAMALDEADNGPELGEVLNVSIAPSQSKIDGAADRIDGELKALTGGGQ